MLFEDFGAEELSFQDWGVDLGFRDEGFKSANRFHMPGFS